MTKSLTIGSSKNILKSVVSRDTSQKFPQKIQNMEINLISEKKLYINLKKNSELVD